MRIALFAGLAAVAVGIVCLIYFFAVGVSSRLAWLALVVVIGGFASLAIQLWFDLKGAVETSGLSAEYTVDVKGPWIRQWIYPQSLGTRYAAEVLASTSLYESDKDAFKRDHVKLASDMTVFSLLAYLLSEQHDWQTETRHITDGLTMGRYLSDPSKSAECAKVTHEQIIGMLREAGNVFADTKLPIPDSFLCLPPQTTIRLEHQAIILKNPFSEIVFSAPRMVEGSFTDPGNGSHMAVEADGKPRYETWTMYVSITRKSLWLRAQHKSRAKYDVWSKGIVEGARVWFVTKTDPAAKVWFGGDSVGALTWASSGGEAGPVWIKDGKVYRQPP